MTGVVIALGIIFVIFIISTLYDHSDTVTKTLESVEVESHSRHTTHMHHRMIHTCDYIPEGEHNMGLTALEYVRLTSIDKK